MKHSRSTRILVVSLLCWGLQAAAPHLDAQAQTPFPGRGAPMFIADDYAGVVSQWDRDGTVLENFTSSFTEDDGFAVGDVTGDGVDEVLVAGDGTGVVDVYNLTGTKLSHFDGDFTTNDGFATGDLDGDGVAEILIAGDDKHNVDIFDRFGNHRFPSFDIAYTGNDGFATGDVDGDGRDEILVGGDSTNNIDIFDLWMPKISFDGGYSKNDGFAAGDVDGDGIDEILVAGEQNENVDIFDVSGEKKGSFDAGFTVDDGFASGDVDADGTDEIVVAGDVTGRLDIFDRFGAKRYSSFDVGFSDKLAVGTSSYPDADGDGLLDQWEEFGLDVDQDGLVDVDLPAMGADPLHKDLFLEFDWMKGEEPKQDAVRAIKDAFAAAPVDAGGVANPDGLPGINLWVDTGALADPNAAEDGDAPGTCQDLLDNGADGLVDSNDPDCLVGDNLGGGNEVPAWPPVPKLNSAFYDVKGANFDPARRMIFRYALSAATGYEDGLQDGGTCTDGIDNLGDGLADGDDEDDCGLYAGGHGERDGNDFVEYNHDGGSIMHEFGHNLGLQHGGFEPHNCKPNYVSVMNYDYQFRIPRTGGPDIIDYSPPRLAGGGRGQAPLPELDEAALLEDTILDPTDTGNQMIFTSPFGIKAQAPLGGLDFNGDGTGDGIDWNRDGRETSGAMSINIDTADSDGFPKDCKNSSKSSILKGWDDWSNISLPFRQFAESADGGINVHPDTDPTLTELLALHEELNTADLRIEQTDTPDPVAAGARVTYSITVSNDGPNPSSQTQVIDTLPAGTTYVSDTGGCVKGPVGVLTCPLGELFPGRTVQFDVTVAVDADLVYVAGEPTTITNSVAVDNLAGPDPDPTDDSASAETQVVAVADLAVLSLEAVNAPTEILIGESLQVTVRSFVTNHGPSAPMNAILNTSGSADAGAAVTPASETTSVSALGLEEQRQVDQRFGLSCTKPGVHRFAFASAIKPAHAADSDPDLSNNNASMNFQVDCVVPVAINIKPGSFPNSISLIGSNVAVAVLTTQAGEYGLPLAFDAARVLGSTVRFGPRDVIGAGGGATELHGTGHLEDARELDERTRDGDLDMVLHFDPSKTGLAPGDTEACVKGKWLDEHQNPLTFFGCDSVRVVA